MNFILSFVLWFIIFPIALFIKLLPVLFIMFVLLCCIIGG